MDRAIHRIEFLDLIEKEEMKRKRKIKSRSCFFEEYDDYDFHCRFRFTKTSVIEVLSLIEDKIEPQSHLNNSLNSLEQLLVALRFYATGVCQLAVGDLSNVSQSTVSRVIRKVSQAIASMRPKFIKMPGTEQKCLTVSEQYFNIAKFPGVIGSVDCTHIPILSPGGDDAERFRCRKGYFSINTQTIVSADLTILDVVARWPGSAHDSTIFSNSSVAEYMQNDILKKFHLIGDSGYPCTPQLMTPINQPTTPSEVRYNKSLASTRNTVERSYGLLKKRFPCLQVKLRCSVECVPEVIVACCVLHNLAIKIGDPEPPFDPVVQQYINNFIIAATDIQNIPSNVSNGSSAGFAKRSLLIQRFFS